MQQQSNIFRKFPKFDRSLFHKASLIPLFAFVGLGADSLSSSCYGPEEAFLGLGNYHHLIIIVGLLAIITIGTISTSYCQIIDLFPSGGGGYLVASKLLSPDAGLVSGCALLVDYILTITISVASGVDAFFNLLPHEHHIWKFAVKIVALGCMTAVNLRGVKESIFPWIPIFFLFAFSHLIAFCWAFFIHFDGFPFIVHGLFLETEQATSSLGLFGGLLLILRSYSVGAGTYTGIEAVSNGMNLFREPRVQNARKTMLYIAIALAVTVSGLVLTYLLYNVAPEEGKTLNGVLMHKIGAEMGSIGGSLFCALALFSESALLIMAAQSGFLGGPRVLANMAADRWLPNKFTNLSDRFVIRHGVLLISVAALALMFYSEGSVSILVVLYSLSVFITFTLSQLGMCNHWTKERIHRRPWLKGLLINGFGFCLVLFVLVSLTLIKFKEGAWLTLLVVASLIFICKKIKAYYKETALVLSELPIHIPQKPPTNVSEVHLDTSLHTAVFFVSGIRNLALHSIGESIKLFGNSIEHFVFLYVGIIDAGAFKGEREIHKLEEHTTQEASQLVSLMKQYGYSAESFIAIGLDIGDEVAKLAKEVKNRHPSSLFLGGQLVFPQETLFSHWMHNQTLRIIQRRIYELQYPFVTIPIYVPTLSLVSH